MGVQTIWRHRDADSEAPARRFGFMFSMFCSVCLAAFGPFVFSALGAAAPPNDNFDNSSELVGASLSFSVSNVGASAETPAEPDHAGEPAQHSVWYYWTAPTVTNRLGQVAPGLLLMEWSSVSLNARIAVYSGKSLAALQPLVSGTSQGLGVTNRLWLPEVSNGAELQIVVDGQNGATGTVTVSLRLVSVPEILLYPVDVRAYEGESASLSVTALGPEPVSYQWQREGADIPGATSTNLLLPVLSEAQAGAYSVTVSNAFGVRTSRPAQLTIRPEPKIVRQPQDVQVSDGQNAEFSVYAVGRQPLSYQWRFQGVDLPGQTRSNLVLMIVQVTNVGAYQVVVNNSAGRVESSIATLSATGGKVTITRQPVGTTNAVGEEIRLDTRVSGSTPIAYQWFFNTNTLLSGQNGAELVITNAQLTDSGFYHLQVDNARGGDTSAVVHVQVVLRPPNDHFVNRIPVTQTNTVVTGYNYGATRESGEPSHNGVEPSRSVWWSWTAPARGLATVSLAGTTFRATLGLYTGTAISALTSVPHMTFFDGQEQTWLTEPGVEYSFAVDSETAWAGDIRLMVLFTTNMLPPDILQRPTGKTFFACDKLELTVAAANRPLIDYPLSYQWILNGTNIPNATNRTYTVASSHLSDAGQYVVKVSNFGGETNSPVAACDVLIGPRVVTPLTDINIPLCEDLRFSVAASGCQPLFYQWTFNTTNLVNATNSAFTLPSVDIDVEGTYVAQVWNADGSTNSKPIRVTVDRRPRIDRDIADARVRECSNQVFQVDMVPSCKPLWFQWYFNGAALSGLPGVRTNRLELINVSTNNQGRYALVVSNEYASITSRVAFLTVSAEPDILRQPEDRTRIRIGSSFSLSVEAQSCTPMTYQWYLNGHTNFPPLTNQTTLLPMLVGLNGPALLFNEPTTNFNGFYSVVVGNANDFVTSRQAKVEILIPPTNDFFAHRIRLAGTNAVDWGHNILATRETNEPIHLSGTSTSNSVWWTWTAPDDAGFLDVRLQYTNAPGASWNPVLALYTGGPLTPATNALVPLGAGSQEVTGIGLTEGTTVHIAVDGIGPYTNSENRFTIHLAYQVDTSPPVILTNPVWQAASLGAQVQFEVAHNRNPHIEYQWYFNPEPLKGDGNFLPLPGATNRVLAIDSVTTSHIGEYRVVLRNKYGTVTSENGGLTLDSYFKGMVTDATNGRPIPGARIEVNPEVTAPFTNVVYTDASGGYELFGVKRGTFQPDFDADRRAVGLNEPVQFLDRSTYTAVTLLCTHPDFKDYRNRQVEPAPGGEVRFQFSMVPKFAKMRIVLNWGATPSDLDAHLVTPPIEGRRYEVWYRTPYNTDTNSAPFARMDYDVATSFGPETITVDKLFPGTYVYYVKKPVPAQQGTLADSQAIVKIYTAQDQEASYSIPVPTNGPPDAPFWRVFDVDGATGTITIVSLLSDVQPSAALAADRPSASIATVFPVSRAGLHAVPDPDLTYLWTFGDGQSSSLKQPIHAYPLPGSYDISLTLTVLGATNTESRTETKTGFITVTNDPPKVRLTAPAPGLIYRLGAPLSVEAEASDSDGSVAKIEFFANALKLGEARSAPWTVPWVPATEGEVVLTAVATDNVGGTSTSEPVSVSIRELTGDLLVLRDHAHPDIDLLATLPTSPCSDIDVCDPLVTRVLDRGDARFDLLSRFRVVVWDDLGETNRPFTEAEIDLFQQAYDSGVALYLMGSHLASMPARMTPGAGAKWIRLTHLASSTGLLPSPQTLTNSAPDGMHYIVNGPCSRFDQFDYANTLEGAALADDNVDVLARASEIPMLLAFPSSHGDTSLTRLVVQNFQISDSDPTSDSDRQALYRAAVGWLAMCPECVPLDLNLESISVADPSLPDLPTAGRPVTVDVLLSRGGACDPTGVILSNRLPSTVRLLGTTPTNYLASGEWVSLRLGRPPSPFRTNITLTFIPRISGELTLLSYVSGNGPDAYPADNSRDLSIEVAPGSSMELVSISNLTAKPKAGQPLTLRVSIRHNGDGDPAGVTVSNWFSPTAHVQTLPSTNVVVQAGALIFRLGRLPNGAETNVTFTLIPTEPGELRVGSCVTANGQDSYPEDNCAEVAIRVAESTLEPPRLRIENLSDQVRINVISPNPGMPHVLEYSTNLPPDGWPVWLPSPAALKTNDGAYFLDPIAEPRKFYRTRAP